MGWFIAAVALFCVFSVYACCVVGSDADDAMEIYEEQFIQPRTTSVPMPEPTETPEAWTRYPVPLDDDLQKYILQLCAEYRFPPSVVYAVIENESHFDASIKGDKKDGFYRSFGLMQVMASEHTARCLRLNVYNLLDPYQNVRAGIDYLAELLDYYDGDMGKALSFYNNDDTGTYAKTVLQRAEQYAESVQSAEG